MALLTFLPEQSHTKINQTPQHKTKQHHNHKQKSKQSPKQNQKQNQNQNQKQKQKQKQKAKQPSSWDQIKNLISCKQIEGSRVHDPSKNVVGYSKLGSSCSSICSFKDVVHGNTRVVHRADNSSPESSTLGQETGLLSRKPSTTTSSSTRSGKSNAGATYTSSSSSSSRAMQFRKLSGCYECHMIVDPSRLPIPRSTVCVCSQCGEVFPKMESMELHQAVRHAVSELGPEDSGRNIVEIIFKSSWLKKDNSICKIERILKVHNTQRTIQRFEDCRDAVKNRALSSTKKNPRCAADGNELLRFHCTTLTCSLGARGSNALCSTVPGCGVCTIIRHGFSGKSSSCGEGRRGVRTTASSGKAHDSVVVGQGGECGSGERAMLVCRVIAGRVKRVAEEEAVSEEGGGGGGSYDSVAGCNSVYSNLEDLVVFNPRAILPCFVVIYEVLSN